MKQNFSASSSKTPMLEALQQQFGFSDEKVRQLQQRAREQLEQGKQAYREQYNSAIRQQLLLSQDVLEALSQLQAECKLEPHTVTQIQQEVDGLYQNHRQQYEKACLEHLCRGQLLADLDRSHLQATLQLTDAREIENLESQAEQEWEAKQQNYQQTFDRRLRQNGFNPRLRADILQSMPYPRLSEACLTEIETEVRRAFERDRKAYQQTFGDALCRSQPLSETETRSLQAEQTRLRFGDDLARSLEQAVLQDARAVYQDALLKKLIPQGTLDRDSQEQLHQLREWHLLGQEASTIEHKLTQAVAAYEAQYRQLTQTYGQTGVVSLTAQDRATLEQCRVHHSLPVEAAGAIKQRIDTQRHQAEEQQRQQYQAYLQEYKAAVAQEYAKPQPDREFLRMLQSARNLKAADVERIEATVQQQIIPPEPPAPEPEPPTPEPIILTAPISHPDPIAPPKVIAQPETLAPEPDKRPQPQRERPQGWRWVSVMVATPVLAMVAFLLYQNWQADQATQTALQTLRQQHTTKDYEGCLRSASTFPANSPLSREAQRLKTQCRDQQGQAFLQQAQTLVNQGKFADAIATINQIDAATPAHAEAQTLLKQIAGKMNDQAKAYYLQQGDPKKAIGMLVQSLKVNSGSPAVEKMIQQLQPEWNANQKALDRAKQALEDSLPYDAKKSLEQIKTTWQGKPTASAYWNERKAPLLKQIDQQIQAALAAEAARQAASQAQSQGYNPVPSGGGYVSPPRSTYQPPRSQPVAQPGNSRPSGGEERCVDPKKC